MIGPRFEWRLPEPLPELPGLSGFSRPILTLLARRGFTQQSSLARFLAAGAADLHPLDGMADAALALDRLELAVERGERVAIWGDYDADGMTALAIWLIALRTLALEPMRYVPSRLVEGYGLSRGGLQSLRDAGVGLVVTCDCGVSNVDEIEFASTIGLDVIVTDHHLPGPRLPKAIAVVDPHRPDCGYPEKELTGAGVAFKLASALLSAHDREIPELVALAAIGTVADMAPLLGENRAIVRLGLAELGRTQRAGLRALVARAAAQPDRPTARDLAYGLGPRLNAAGRIAEAELGIQLLLADDRDRAEELADQLEALNRRRQALTGEAVDQALGSVASRAGDGPVVVRGDEWPPGIIGLIAGRLSDALLRPVAVVCALPDEMRGSVRAPADFHVARALAACAEHLSRFGGHPAAGGFSVAPQSLAAFCVAFEALPRPFPVGSPMPAAGDGRSRVDLVLPAAFLGWPLCAELEQLAPFGAGHPEPVLAITGLAVGDVRRTGPEDGHVVLRLLRGRETFDAIAFHTPPDRPLPAQGMRLDVLGTVETDHWMGEPRMRLRVLDWAEAEASPLLARRAAISVAAPR